MARPIFESVAFAVETRAGQRPVDAARSAVRAAFPRERWTIEQVSRVFLTKPATTRRLSEARAWQRTYALRDQPQVAYAEPLFLVDESQQHQPKGKSKRSAGTDDDPRTEGRFEWPLETMKVIDAWEHATGSGVRVGHPDTGYTRHPEIDGTRLDTGRGFDFEDDKADPHDPLAGGFMRNPGHGTATASIIMSARGDDDPSDEAFVSGTAPAASLVPIRTTRSVVLWSMERLVRAIAHAIEQSCHVVSISLGGLPYSQALHDMVIEAEAQGVIVLCAAGNQVRIVVYPAAFDEVIAVAASDIADKPWKGSCRGPAVDITAPGHSVYRARVQKKSGKEKYSVARSSGTSYAVAATAGVAALWLSRHGRTNLIDKYGRNRIVSVFKQLLQDTCRPPTGWDADEFGPGIVHADRLLETSLPPHAPARGMRRVARTTSIDELPLERIVHVLAPARRSVIERKLAEMLRVSEAQLPIVLADIGPEIAFRIATDAELRAQLSGTRPRGRRGRRVAAGYERRRLAHGASPRLRRTLRGT